MASPGRSMGLVLHDEEGKLEGVGSLGVGVGICVVGRGESFVVAHLVGRGGFSKNKSTRRAAPCFSLKMHEPAGSSHLRTQNSMVCSCSCSIQHRTVELKSFLSMGPCLYL